MTRDQTDQCRQLHQQGKSIRDIAQETGISKSQVGRVVKNFTGLGQDGSVWRTIRGAHEPSVDAFGAIPAPSMQDLANAFEHSVFIAASWLSENVAKVPLRVILDGESLNPSTKTRPLTKALDPNVREVTRHPLKELLDNPCPAYSRTELLQLIDNDLSLMGNSFVRKLRSEDGSESALYPGEGLPVALVPLPTPQIELAYDANGRHVGYKAHLGSTQVFYPQRDVIWFRAVVDPANRYGMGKGPVRAIYERVLLEKQELAYWSSLYRNQGMPNVMITANGINTANAEVLEKTFQQRFRGGGQGGAWVVDGQDLKVTPLSFQPKELVSVEEFRWTKLQILNAFGISPALFDSESSNRATAETALYMSQKNAVWPRCCKIADKLTVGLAHEFDDRLTIAFDDPVTPQEDAAMGIDPAEAT